LALAQTAPSERRIFIELATADPGVA